SRRLGSSEETARFSHDSRRRRERASAAGRPRVTSPSMEAGKRGSLALALATAAFAVAAHGCATEPAVPERTRTIRGQGFVVQDDGSLEPSEEQKLFSELADSRARVLRPLGRSAAPGDFRTFQER